MMNKLPARPRGSRLSPLLGVKPFFLRSMHYFFFLMHYYVFASRNLIVTHSKWWQFFIALQQNGGQMQVTLTFMYSFLA